MRENNTYNEELGGKNLPESLRVNPFAIPTNFFEEQEKQIHQLINLEKLTSISNYPILSNATAMHVPVNYFESLENSIFAKISEQDLKDKISDDGFVVPESYFEELENAIDLKISEEHVKSFAPTLAFDLPKDYFMNAEDAILAKIAEQNILEKAGKDNAFTVPSMYFENASAAIEHHIFVDKLAKEIGKDGGFNVRTGYFDILNEKILDQTIGHKEEEAQIIKLPKRTVWKKYAAAAVALIIGTGAYFGFQQSNSNQQTHTLVDSDVQLEHISDEEILSYLAHVSEGEDLIQLTEFASKNTDEKPQFDSNIDNEEIEDYLNYML